MLRILIDTLPNLAKKSPELTDATKSTEVLTVYFLINQFVDKIIKNFIQRNSANLAIIGGKNKGDKEKEVEGFGCFFRQIMAKITSLALETSSYFVAIAPTKGEINCDSVFGELSPLIKWDNTLLKFKFSTTLLGEFFVAKGIEAEIVNIFSSSEDSHNTLPKKFLLNQKLLTRTASLSSVTLFLRDAIWDQNLKLEQLKRVIWFSRPKTEDFFSAMPNRGEKIELLDLQSEATKSKERQSPHASSDPPFSIAAANAITILNASGYDFSNHDFSDVSIPAANLSCGIFEGTNFNNANLEGVDFTGAWLKDAQFIKTNMNNLEFGEFASQCFNYKRISRLAFSANGKFLAADLDDQTVILKNFSDEKFHLREIQKIPGRFSDLISFPFSRDGKQIATVLKNECIIWDIDSGQAFNKFNLPVGSRKIINFSPDMQETILLSDDKRIAKLTVASNRQIDFQLKVLNEVTNCDFNLKKSKLLLVGDHDNSTSLYHSITGKLLQKQRQETASCKLNLDGKQILSGTTDGIVSLSDCFRGHMIKCSTYHKYKTWCNEIHDCSFMRNGELILSQTPTKLILQEATDTKNSLVEIDNKSWGGFGYSLSPDSSLLAITNNAENDKIEFLNILNLENSPHRANFIYDFSTKGLNLIGTVASNCIWLSEENIRLFQTKGDYGLFKAGMLRKLFPDSLAGAQSVKEIILPNQNLSAVHGSILGNDLQWVNLRILNLSKNAFKDEGAMKIASNTGWINLEEIDLSSNELGINSASAICNNTAWGKLKVLNLQSNKIGDEGACIIGNNTIWKELRTLKLGYNEIGYKGIFELSKNTAWKNLQTIDLGGNRIEDRGVSALSKNTTWVKLEALFLYENLISAKGAAMLSRNTTWPNMRKLDLDLNLIGEEGVLELSINKIWTNLQKLYLRSNHIGPAGVVRLRNTQLWSKIRTLNLEFNQIGTEGAEELSKNTNWTDLRKLNLEGNCIGSRGVSELSKNKYWAQLEIFNIGFNSIGAEGAAKLSKNSTWTNLKRLYLCDNQIGNEGLLALSKNTTWINLQVLDLRGTCFTVEGLLELRKNTTWSNLQELHFSYDLDSISPIRYPHWPKLKIAGNIPYY